MTAIPFLQQTHFAFEAAVEPTRRTGDNNDDGEDYNDDDNAGDDDDDDEEKEEGEQKYIKLLSSLYATLQGNYKYESEKKRCL
jgi:hypothetical protein